MTRESRENLQLMGVATALTIVVIATVMLFAGCAGMLTGAKQGRSLPHEKEALAIAWEMLGRTDSPPQVHYVEGERLTCVSSDGRRGFYSGMISKDGEAVCAMGVTYDPFSVAVALQAPDQKLAETSLCHEARHAAQAREGVVDPFHQLPGWEEFEATCRAELRSRGW